MRKLSYAVALLESFALVSYAISIIVSATQVDSKVGSPIVETIIYLIFAGLIFACGQGVNKAKDWARTPYLLSQAFGLIVAYTLLAGTEVTYKVIGLLIGIVSIAGIFGLLKAKREN
ncbi:MAG: hypothetical protein RIR66_193 [Actinomycetota bacterium]|jgi:hypothetical protein